MILVALESPYAGQIDQNVEYARLCVADCLLRGEAPIASHLLYTQPGILDDKIPAERDLGIKAGLLWARQADYAVVYTDRGISQGMKEAIAFYNRNHIPIYYRKLKDRNP